MPMPRPCLLTLAAALSLALSANTPTMASGAAGASSPPEAIGLHVETEGVYRITYDYLNGNGYDPAAMTVANLGLSDDGTHVPIYISHSGTSATLQEGDYIEFYAHPLNNTYSTTNVYVLTDDGSATNCPSMPGGSCHIVPTRFVAPQKPSTLGTGSYVDQHRTLLDPAATGLPAYTVDTSWPSVGDQHWVEMDLCVGCSGSGPVTKTLSFSISTPAASGTCDLTVPMLASVDSPKTASAQQAVSLAINGNPVTNTSGGGQSFSWNQSQITGFYDAEGSFPCSDLQTSSTGSTTNTLAITASLPSGVTLDEVLPQSFAITYSENLCAVNDQLQWSGGDGSSYFMSGFDATPIHVWRVAGAQERLYVKLPPAISSNTCGTNQGYALGDPASGAAGYYASAKPLVPASSAPLDLNSITSGGANSAQYLVITSPQWAGDPELAALAADHQPLTYKIVDTQSIYDQYRSALGAFTASSGATASPGDGQLNPEAIRAYIQFAQANLGTEYVLLAGGDTFDYHNFYGCPASGRCSSSNPENVSIVPTLYENSVFNGPTPSDNLFAVAFGQQNTAPDLAIGRLPAVTQSQLELEAEKSLDWLNGSVSSYKGSAAMVSGFPSSSNYCSSAYADSSFGSASSQISTELSNAGMSVQQLPEDGTQSDDEANRANLLTDINGGTEIVNFIGHGNTAQWSCLPDLQASSPTAVGYAGSLTNSNKATAVFQWGCQATYVQDPGPLPNLDSVLLSDEDSSGNPTGATIAVGSAGDDVAGPQEVLAGGESGGGYFYGYLIQGETVGQALEHAKDDLANNFGTDPDYADVVNSYTILGDPALSVPM